MYLFESSFCRSFNVALAMITIICSATACSPFKGQAPIGGGSQLQGGGAGSPSTTASPVVQEQINAMNQNLNSQESYALSTADVSLLAESGVLADGDSQSLSPMVKK